MNTIRYLTLLAIMLTSLACTDKKDSKATGSSVMDKSTSVIISDDCPQYIQKEKQNNLNISILLDLSDRIEGEKIIDKDLAYLRIISEVFTDHIKTKKVAFLHDKMQVYFHPEPSSAKINNIAEKLEVHFTNESPKLAIDETLELYSNLPAEIYTLAQEDAGNNPNNYPGADIYRFFKDNVNDYCIEQCTRNILVILTDGYMYHENTDMKEGGRTAYLTPKYLNKLRLDKSNWEDEVVNKNFGFIVPNKDLSDLEVLVLGIENKNENNPYTLDVITKYWEDWFEGMNVGSYKIKDSALPQNVEKVIREFI